MERDLEVTILTFTQQKLSMNNALDEFYHLTTSNKILVTNTANLKRSDLSFITLRTFLGERSKNRNPAQKLVKALITNVLGRGDIHDEMVPQIFDNVPAEICEGMVSLQEATEALKKMKNGSAPGGDGLTIEYMKFFWNFKVVCIELTRLRCTV